MGKIIVSEYITLDGVVEESERWFFQYDTPEIGEHTRQQSLNNDAMLLGRVTYQAFASFWPTMTNNEFGIADKFNNTPKYVVSTTLETAHWNNSTLIKENVVEEIARLKQQHDGNIGITGSITLIQSLLQAGLVDEFQLLLYPVVIGSGRRLFGDGSDLTGLKLVESKTFDSGVIALTYRTPDKEAA